MTEHTAIVCTLAVVAGQGVMAAAIYRVIRSFGQYTAKIGEHTSEVAEHTRSVDKARLYHMAVHDEQRRMWSQLLKSGTQPAESIRAQYTPQSDREKAS